MTTEKIDIKVAVKSAKAKAQSDAVIKKFTTMQQRVNMLNTSFGRFSKTVVNGLNKSSQEVVRFNGNLLSTLFFGMELKRIFGGALQSVFEAYKKIAPESTNFNRLTTRLSANWQFFKFQLADALAQSPIFQKFIQFAIGLLQAFQKLPQPVKTFIGFLLIVGTIIGGLLFLVGVWGLGIAGMINLFASMGGAAAITASIIGGITKAITLAKAAVMAFYASWFLPIAAIILIAALWKKYVDRFSSDLGFQIDSWKDYVTIFVGAFVNGIGQILITLLRLPAGFIDIFVNIIKGAIDFAVMIKDIIKAAFDPDTTISGAWDKFYNKQIDRFSNFGESGTLGLLTQASGTISDFTLNATRDAVNSSNDAGKTVVNNNFITLDEALAQGIIDQEAFDNARGVTTSGI